MKVYIVVVVVDVLVYSILVGILYSNVDYIVVLKVGILYSD